MSDLLRQLFGVSAENSDRQVLGLEGPASKESIIRQGRARLQALQPHEQSDSSAYGIAEARVRLAVGRLVRESAGESPPAAAEVPTDPHTLAALAALARRGSRTARVLLVAAHSCEIRGDLGPAGPAAVGAKVSEPMKIRESFKASKRAVQEELAPAGPDSMASSSSALIVVAGSALASLAIAALVLWMGNQDGQVAGATRSVAPVEQTAMPVAAPAPAPESATSAVAVRPAVATPGRSGGVANPLGASTATVLDTRQESTSELLALLESWKARVDSTIAVLDGANSSEAKCKLVERLDALDGVARLIDAKRLQESALLLEVIPLQPVLPEESIMATQEWGLSASLASAGSGGELRVSILRRFGQSASADRLTAADAQGLADEALSGPSRASREVAQSLLLSRYVNSSAAAVGMLNSLASASALAEVRGFIEAFAKKDIVGAGATARLAMRQGLMSRALETGFSAVASIDETPRAMHSPAETFPAEGAIGPLQVFVASNSGALRQRSAQLSAERPALAPALKQIVESTERNRARSASVLDQMLINGVAALRMRALASGVQLASSPRAMGADEAAGVSSTPSDPADQLPEWAVTRLELLDPSRPLDYLELGEELADGTRRGSTAWITARTLFALTGAIDSSRYARSALLAIASLEETGLNGLSARLVALRASRAWASPLAVRGSATAEQRLLFAEAMADLRMGAVKRGNNKLEKPEIAALREFYTGNQSLTELDLMSSLLMERAALRDDGQLTWAEDLAIRTATPLPEVDPRDPWNALGEDVNKQYWRGGSFVGLVAGNPPLGR